MKYCKQCGSRAEDEERFCKYCGARLDDVPPNANNSMSQNAGPQTYSAPPAGPARKSNVSTIVVIISIAVVLLLVMTLVIPNFVNVDKKADYQVSLTISNISIDDPDDGFHYAEKDSYGRLHTYIMYSDYKSDSNVKALGWCATDGTVMDLSGHDELTIDVNLNGQSKVVFDISLVVVTKTINSENHYDIVDTYDISSEAAELPPGDHQFGATGVRLSLNTDFKGTLVFEGDSLPTGTMTLTVNSITRK